MINDTYGLKFDVVLSAVRDMLETFAEARVSRAPHSGTDVAAMKAGLEILRTLVGKDRTSAMKSDDDQLPHVAMLLADPNAKVEYATLALAAAAVWWGAQMTETPWREVLGHLEKSNLDVRINESE